MQSELKKMEYICVFDCETIPDVESLVNVLPQDLVQSCYKNSNTKEIDDEKLSQLAGVYCKENYGTEFLPVCFHKVVCISAVMADKFGRFLRVSTMGGASEKEKIEKFINFISEYNPRLVSYNGRGFDLPMIMIKAMKYNLSCSAYYEDNNKEFNKSKWENYRSRYDGRFHLDLLDHISEFRVVSGLKLDFICTALNLPGKYDVHGDQVNELYYNNLQPKIDEYCESDVLNTYWLFLKYELLKGNIIIEDYSSYLVDMKEFLISKKEDMSYTNVFKSYIDTELDRIKNENY